MQNEMENEHREPDIGTAAFMLIRGFRLLGLSSEGRGRFSFRFADVDGSASQAALEYLSGAECSASALVDAQKNLKTLLYTKKGNDGYGKQQHDDRR